MTKPVVVVLSGIIGAGKSVLLTLLANRLTKEGYRVAIVKEPVDEWKETGILQSFYEGPDRWGYTFQAEAFRTRVMTIRSVLEETKTSPVDVILMERSPWDDKIFMEMLRDSKTISEMEWTLYKGWCDLWELLLPITPDFYILLSPSVDECQRRITLRGRPGEDKITTDYQSSLKKYHDKFFTSGNLASSGGARLTDEKDVEESCAMIGSLMVPCYHLTTQENFRDDPEVQDKMVGLFKKILRFHS